MKKLLVLILSLTSLLTAGVLTGFGGAAVTPSQYDVIVQKIRFKKSDNTYFTYFSGASTVSLGSSTTSANATAGTIGAGVTFPEGTYNEMEITISRAFTVTATGTSNSQICSTATGASGSIVATDGGSFAATIPTGGALGSSATSQQITVVPTEIVSSINNAGSYFNVGTSNIVMTFPISGGFTVVNNTQPPSMDIKFDVANSVELLVVNPNQFGAGVPSAASCLVLVLPPQITFTFNGASSVTTSVSGYAIATP